MGLVDDVNVEIKAAMRARDKVRLGALRAIRASFIEGMKENGADTLSDDACVVRLRRLEKKHLESIDAFTKGDREEMAAEERAQLSVVSSFLPSLADEATTRAWVTAAIAASGAASPKDMGRVMGMLMKDHKGEVDGKLAKDIAASLLS